jgi:hypothetical protein
MKKLLLALAFVCTAVFAQPTTESEVLERCNLMGNIAYDVADARIAGLLSQRGIAMAIDDIGKSDEFPDELKAEAQASMMFGWVNADKLPDALSVGRAAAIACVHYHKKRLGL